jgi:hypothetical protein
LRQSLEREIRLEEADQRLPAGPDAEDPEAAVGAAAPRLAGTVPKAPGALAAPPAAAAAPEPGAAAGDDEEPPADAGA